MRLIVEFGKLGRLRFISHLDLQRFMQRAFRRTDLPVAYSQGFNPHPLLAFASALAMGWSSDCELMDIKLSAPVEKQRAMEQIAAALPPEMPVRRARLVEDKHPALMARLAWAEYRIAIGDGEAADAIRAAVPMYLAECSVLAMRKTKSGEKECDIRPMTHTLAALPNGELFARLSLTEQATLKPDLLIQTLATRAGVDAPPPTIHRIALLAEQGGQMTPLFEL